MELRRLATFVAVAEEASFTRAADRLIRNGLAIGMLPRSHVETDEITFVPIREQPPQFQTAVAIPAKRRLSAATRAMLGIVKRHSSA